MASAETLHVADPRALARAADVIRDGGVVAVPTETFYGLAADAANAAAIARIFEIKGRPESMQLPLVAASMEQIERILGPVDIRSAKAAAAFWPGPLTLVLTDNRQPASAAPASAGKLAAGNRSVAVRVPGHDFVRHLCDRAGALLTATSANRSGEPPAQTAGDVQRAAGALIDLIMDGGPTPGGKPSTIADLRHEEPRLIRDGAVAWSEVLRAIGKE